MSGYTGVFALQKVGANDVAGWADSACVGINDVSFSKKINGEIDANGLRTLSKQKSVGVPRRITIEPHAIAARIDPHQHRKSSAWVVDRSEAKSRIRSGGCSNEQNRAERQSNQRNW